MAALPFTDLHSFKDYVTYVQTYLPDRFPRRDAVAIEDQWNLERAFDGLRSGLKMAREEFGERQFLGFGRSSAFAAFGADTMISPNGIAHIQLTVRDVAASRPFYHRLLVETFGMAIQYDVPGQIFYCIGARTGVLIRPAAPEHKDTPFDQWRIGLHHFCFRLRAREDVDALATSMQEFGANIIRLGEEGPWAPGYYSTLFEDPDGIRIEALFIPGAGNLDRIKDAPLTPVVN